MDRDRPAQIPGWLLFVLPAAVAVPIVTGILFGGPALGFLAALLVGAAVVTVAIRMRPRRRAAAAAPPAGSDAAPDRSDAGGPGRAAAIRFLVPLAVAASGIVLAAATTGTARIVGWGLLGVAVTLALSLAFLEVGYSEDRARDRERRRGSHVPPRGRR